MYIAYLYSTTIQVWTIPKHAVNYGYDNRGYGYDRDYDYGRRDYGYGSRDGYGRW